MHVNGITLSYSTAQQKIYTYSLLEIAAWIKSGQDGGSFFYSYHLGALSILKRYTSKQNHRIQGVGSCDIYMYEIQI